ncbi:MAG: radical SAM protein [Deltaproteobacteria bacterium]|nr:radical SAM protein [Deltaproteobacteria bacterium]
MKDKESSFVLNSLYLYLTGHCNLCCTHCWISPEFSQKQQRGIPLKALKSAISDARSLGLQNVKLTGGEPLLYRDISGLLSFLSAEEISITIETNGTLIDREIIERLQSCDLEQISVSLDAATEDIHDELRGVKGSFHRALDGLRLLSEYHFDFQIIMTIQRRNRNEIPGMISLSEKLGASSLKINPMLPCGRGKNSFKQKQNLELHELICLYRMVEEEFPQRDNYQIFFDLPAPFLSIEEIKQSGTNQCHILNILGVLANGDVSICGIGQTSEELRMGNLSQDSIVEIWHNNSILNELRESLPWKLKGICGRCIFKFQCLGACRANAYTLNRDLYAPYFLCQEFFEAGLFPPSRYIPE